MRFLLFFLYTSFLYSQTTLNLTNWKNYSDLKSINKIALYGNLLWAGTNGGSFSYNKSTNSFKGFSSIDGLNSIEISTIGIDNRNKVWFGNSNGFIDIYDPDNNSWKHIQDIFLSTNSVKKTINSFFIKGDSVYIACDLGISLYDQKNEYFLDTYQKLGTFPTSTPVNDLLIFDNKIWAITSEGVAYANVNSKNLLAPEEWSNFTIANSLSSNNVTTLTIFKNFLYIGTGGGIQKYNGKGFVLVGFQNTPISTIASTNDAIYLAIYRSVYKMDIDNNITKVGNDLPDDINSIKIDESNNIWVGLSSKGLYFYDNKNWNNVIINSPNSNKFISLAVDDNGTLWCATGKNGQGGGFFSLKDGNWMNYTVEKYPILRTNDYYRIIVGPDNQILAGSWGRGIALLKNDSIIKIFNEKNSRLKGLVDDPAWVTISGMAYDDDKNLWILNYFSNSGEGLIELRNDSTWLGFSNNNNTTYWDIKVDDIGTKWMLSGASSNELAFFNERYIIKGADVNNWGLITSSEGGFGSVNCLTRDKNGEIWIGTDKGVLNIINTRDPKANNSIGKPCYYVDCNITGQYINCITIDALNNKWVGTQSSGVWVLNADGSKVIAQINTQNSKIVDDNIKTIAFDSKNGTVYIGTEKGLTSAKTILVEPLVDFQKKLKISPNPFITGTKNLLIDGLIESANVKIVSSSGKLIKQISSPGGRVAFWDGKDDNNNYVSSGIYFIIAYSVDGTQTSIGKVAILQK